MAGTERLVLVVIEHDCEHVKPASLRAVSAARQLGGAYSLICIGHGVERLAASLTDFGAAKVYVVDHEDLAEPIAHRYANLVADVVELGGTRTIIAASSTFSRDLLPRVAALIDAP